MDAALRAYLGQTLQGQTISGMQAIANAVCSEDLGRSHCHHLLCPCAVFTAALGWNKDERLDWSHVLLARWCVPAGPG
jgi:hypothetical protein